MTTEWTDLEEITDWTKCLLEVPSSRHFSELKSFKLFFSNDCLSHWQMLRNPLAETLTKEMRRFEKEMTTACKSVEVECYLNLPLRGLFS